MENRGQSYNFSAAGYSMGMGSHHHARRSFLPLPEEGYGTPENVNVFSGGRESLEEAISRLRLSAPPPPPHHLPGIADGLPVVNSPGIADGLPVVTSPVVQRAESSILGYFNPMLNHGWNNVLVGSQAGDGGGFQNHAGQGFGAHRNLMVGPAESWDCGPGLASGRSGGVYREFRYGDLPAALNTELSNFGNSQRWSDQGYSYLQCKQGLPRRVNYQFPTFSSDHNEVSRLNLDALLNGVDWKNSTTLRLNSHNNGQIYARTMTLYDGISLQDMRGAIAAISKDQNGSKILQEKLDFPSEEEIEMVLGEVIDQIAELMKIQPSSYFVQKLFGVCSEEQRTRIIAALTLTSFQILDVCLNFNGARTMQKLLENLSTPEQISLVTSALLPGSVSLATDPNGQHVIRYCFIHYPYEYHKDILKEIANSCYRIATDKSGCCVLQSCVEHSHGHPKDSLIREIIANALPLAEDPYGNYVVQHLLGLKMHQYTALLLGKLRGHFVALSCDKYGSNVVEKFLVEAQKEHSTVIIMEILANPNADSLLVHPYGNFVIQKALAISRGSEVYRALCNLIDINAPAMRSNLFGKKILAWFEKRKQLHVV